MFNIKPDAQVRKEQEEEARRSLGNQGAVGAEGDDDYLKVPDGGGEAAGLSDASSAGSAAQALLDDPNFKQAGCQNEDDVIELIDHSF